MERRTIEAFVLIAYAIFATAVYGEPSDEIVWSEQDLMTCGFVEGVIHGAVGEETGNRSNAALAQNHFRSLYFWGAEGDTPEEWCLDALNKWCDAKEKSWCGRLLCDSPVLYRADCKRPMERQGGGGSE